MSHAAMTVDLAHEGNLADLFHAHKRMLWGLSYRMTGCAADADDIVQETFTRAMERATLSDYHAWRPWLMCKSQDLI